MVIPWTNYINFDSKLRYSHNITMAVKKIHCIIIMFYLTNQFIEYTPQINFVIFILAFRIIIRHQRKKEGSIEIKKTGLALAK